MTVLKSKDHVQYEWCVFDNNNFYVCITASQHSGTVEDEREEADDEDAETRCFVCEKPYNDIDQWVFNIPCKHINMYVDYVWWFRAKMI